MTAHTIRLGVKNATVAGDTLSYTADKRPAGVTSKCLVLPQALAVLLCRGQTGPFFDAWAVLMSQLDLNSLEQVAERLPGILRDVSKAYAAMHRIGDYRRIAMLEVCVIGWSAKQKCIRMVQFFNHTQDYEAQWIEAPVEGDQPLP
jgi:hypothetical protein